jgi:hypothetical protein
VIGIRTSKELVITPIPVAIAITSTPAMEYRFQFAEGASVHWLVASDVSEFESKVEELERNEVMELTLLKIGVELPVYG